MFKNQNKRQQNEKLVSFFLILFLLFYLLLSITVNKHELHNSSSLH